MNLQKLTVGQMAELNHVSRQTLRLYDKEGILRPISTDENSGYRYYHILQSARLDLIQNMKVYGMTLTQIKDALGSSDCVSLREILSAQEQKILCKIEQLERSRAAIVRALDNYAKYEAMPKNSEIFLEFIQKRRIFRYSCDVNYFEQDEIGYEFMLRQLKNHLALSSIPLSYFSNIGTIIRKEDLLRDRLYSDEVFIFLDDSEDSEGTETLPSGYYICLCSDEFSQEERNAERLLEYIKEHNYVICGDYLCEVVVDFRELSSLKRDMYYKIQIPVRYFG